ncbi:LysR family transcriptional regulator [Mycolicibacterium goodii]|uniref:LysR family transcriptional regulator n=1 Tax=Mycolicibacterium goodii TaxID=134601 RepID=A0ABS6HRP6_MYCGD|nr:LysR family transcriptional regulator [Mycolicibacterium goodii]OKH75453.1 LysR family transcriptional regulator [Mycobacterium sp. SWH-M5]MBU8814404.1 LysR family transcriptional regulator [Mycolicibacterium goodii]MBU8824898.1 LysR family transcriptional regulator [Mycolicibacterium goodii]MBU8839897.1 LysR family transcriptional regulator [Mycolicibacterium goodii]PJK21254.1 LysR family transcriptional regulator [Mycolicibacterium goodii]
MRQTHITGVDLNLLPALFVLLEERQVSRAATRVGLSQPAMSRALQRLRRIFDDALLVPGRDGYTLTPRAERLRTRLAGVMPELDALFGPEHFEPGTATGSYRLALSDYSVALFGADLARTIHQRSPGSSVVYQQLGDEAFAELNAGGIDLLVLGRPAPSHLAYRELFTDHFVCAVSHGHPLADRGQLSIDDYLKYPHIRIEIEQGTTHLIEDALPGPRKVAISTPFYTFAVDMLSGTDLVVTFPARLVAKLTNPSGVRIVDAPESFPELPFYAVWHPRLDHDASHRWLRSMLYQLTA